MNKNNEFEELKDKGSTLSVHTGDPLAIREMQKNLSRGEVNPIRLKNINFA